MTSSDSEIEERKQQVNKSQTYIEVQRTIDDDDGDRIDELRKEDDTLIAEAQLATVEEHKLTLIQGIRKYPTSVFWSFWFSTALIMEGFDHAFVGGFFAFPKFQARYGTYNPKTKKTAISATMQAGIHNGVSAGEIIGLLFCGLFADRIGYRWVMIGALILMIGFVFLQFFANSLNMYLGAEILLGLPWGAFQTLTTTYAAEITPLVLRPYLTMLVSLCWSVGYLAGIGTLRGFLKLTTEWAYRIPFALQWIWPIPLAVGIYFAPDSPWWLVRRNKIEKATQTVKRLLFAKDEETTDDLVSQQVSLMVYTHSIEKEMNKNSSYLDCFKGVDLRRTEIALICYVVQVLCAPLFGNTTYFLEQAGLKTAYAFDFSCVQYALAIIGVFVSWSIIHKVGRRTLYLTGISINSSFLIIIGFMGIPDLKKHSSVAYGIGVMLLIQYFLYFITIGPIGYTIVTEMPSNQLRAKTVVLGRVVYNIASIINGQLVPRMIQRATWNWGAKAGFLWGGILAFVLVWAYFRLPETKGRTFAEIDILFKNRVPARKFSKTHVDIANEEVYEED